MSSSDDPPKATAGPSILARITKFLLGSCVVGGIGGGLVGVAFVIIASMVDPNSARVGGANDPGGLAVVVFFAWGFAGLIVGAAVGIVGAMVIAIRR